MRFFSLAQLTCVAAIALSSAGCDPSAKDSSGDPGASDSGGAEGEGEGEGEGGVEYDDADQDGIIDGHEGTVDTDGDGTPDYTDTDSDDDGIADKEEAGDDDPLTLPHDSDSDGVADYLDDDSDNNCVGDTDEGSADPDGDGIPNYRDLDNDGDGILDSVEIGDDCAAPDSDADGIADYADRDSDGDGIGDKWEAGTTEWESEPQDTDGDGTPDYLDVDSDGDGITDATEGGVGDVDQEPSDTDGDGEYDFEDTDSDGDSLTDSDETETYGTDPYEADTDGDGFSDGGEVAAGTDPRDSGSVIDGLYVEVPERTEVEEIFKFELKIEMGDIAFLLDTTCSMSGTATAMASEFSTIVSELADLLPDAQYGHSTFDDYPYASYGSAGSDKPFYLEQQVTDDIREVQSALSATTIDSGADGPEAGMEALYQAASGLGYDQDCDASYDAVADVLPFLADPGDPFGGTAGQQKEGGDESTGDLGGLGFREYALPIIIYAGDNYLRDPESDNAYYNGSPGGCPFDAGYSDVVSSFTGLGAYLIGISVNGTTGTPQLQELTDATSSYADTDGDGMADDNLVFTWSGADSEFRDTVVQAIEDLVSAIRFHRLSLEIEGDDWGFVTGVDPEYYDIEGEVEGEVVDFTITFRGVVAATSEDQLFALTLNVLGDESVLLDTMDIIIVVPGNSY